MKTIKFSKDFKKLNDPYFPTIRLTNKGRTGEEVIIKTPTKEFKAILIMKRHVYLDDISTYILLKDADASTRAEAIKVLQEFYPDLVETSKVYLYYFLKRKE